MKDFIFWFLVSFCISFIMNFFWTRRIKRKYEKLISNHLRTCLYCIHYSFKDQLCQSKQGALDNEYIDYVSPHFTCSYFEGVDRVWLKESMNL